MKIFNACLFVVLASLIMFSCSSGDSSSSGKNKKDKPVESASQQSTGDQVTEQKQPTNNEAFNAEKMAEFKKPRSTGNTYFIPKNISKETAVPVIFVFDPHADGAFPVEKYKALANTFGYALAGSGESKNGQDLSTGIDFFRKMKNEISARQAIDERRIYLMGFSGGSRVAANIAITEKNVSGVIGCGAGLPGESNNLKPDFDYLGIVGNEDFNMSELIRLDITLRKTGFNSDVIVFDGMHAWPPEEVMREAFLWLECCAMKRKLIPQNNTRIDETKQWFDNSIQSLENNNRIFDAAQAAQRAIHYLDGLSPVAVYEDHYKKLTAKPGYQDQFSRKVKFMQMEMGKQNELLSAFTTRNQEWWTETVKELYRPLEEPEQQNMNHRLLSWLGLVAYLSADNALKKKQKDVAEKFIGIYGIIEPLNPEVPYLNAVLQMQLNKPEEALGYLMQAMILGFTDKYRLINDTAFIPLHQKTAFNALFDIPAIQ